MWADGREEDRRHARVHHAAANFARTVSREYHALMLFGTETGDCALPSWWFKRVLLHTEVSNETDLCGQMGVNKIAGTLGCTMLPPALMLYAVDPVGVAMMRPSA